MTTLRTDRLTLRPLVDGDAPAYAAMRHHPEVAKWLPAEPGDPLEHARSAISRFAEFWRERGHAPWGIFLRDRLIGHGGLNLVPVFGETEVLYGSVTTSDIAAALAAKGFEIDRRKIQLQEPLKRLGEFDVPIRLHRDVTTTGQSDARDPVMATMSRQYPSASV